MPALVVDVLEGLSARLTMIDSEEVRLIKENMERYRGLLDREKARLEADEDKVSEENLAVIRERIREYERVVKLNRDQLDRLSESKNVAQHILD
jgi:hypothetical protein